MKEASGTLAGTQRLSGLLSLVLSDACEVWVAVMSVGVVRADAFRVLNSGWAWEGSHSVCRKPQTWRWYERPVATGGCSDRLMQTSPRDCRWLAARSPIKLLRKRSTEFLRVYYVGISRN